MGYYIHIGWNPQPELERVVINDAPRFMRGLRLMFASDFHIRPQTSDEYISSLCGLLASQNADMLMLGGDYGETDIDAARLMCAIDKNAFPLGIYGVVGNNDIESFSGSEGFARIFPGELLVNRACRIRRNGGNIVIGGYDELKYGSFPRRSVFSPTSSDYNILISHYPCMPSATCSPRPRLMLSGHTHGGQISLSSLSVYTLGMERSIVHHVNGSRIFNGTRLITSPGIGVSRFPIRLGARPKVHLIEFI